MAVEVQEARPTGVNSLGLSRGDYRGLPSTLCSGCGHNSISSQVIAACYEMSLPPWKTVKLSGIGCSSKSPAYFLNRSHGFNGLHGRMPSLATGALVANRGLRGIAVSGDGDTASIGIGQFIHMLRRNIPMVYIVENNGVYGLTKGQFSATADKGQVLKKGMENPFNPVDICIEALAANCGFVARSFAGDPRQVKELIKAALGYNGTAVLDIISPCRCSPGGLDQFLHLSWVSGERPRATKPQLAARASMQMSTRLNGFSIPFLSTWLLSAVAENWPLVIDAVVLDDVHHRDVPVGAYG